MQAGGTNQHKTIKGSEHVEIKERDINRPKSFREILKEESGNRKQGRVAYGISGLLIIALLLSTVVMLNNYGELKNIKQTLSGYSMNEEARAVNQQLNSNSEETKEILEDSKDKKVAIYYYKGPGQNALTAAGMEVVPSLYNLLLRMKQEGYNVSGLPANAQELAKMIQAQGAVFNSYAEGAFDEFMKNGNPELITKEQYESWVKESLRPEKYAEVVAADGEFPGNYMVTSDGCLAFSSILASFSFRSST